MGLVDKVKARLSSVGGQGGQKPASAAATGSSSAAAPATTATTTDSAVTSTPATANTTTAPAAPDSTAAPATTETGTGGKMTAYEGKCHCGHHTWTVELTPDQSKHILCHCDTCKILGGGAYSMNQIVPKSALKITSGGEPSAYTYHGESGKAVNCYYCPKCTTHLYHHQEAMGPDTIVVRTGLLPQAREKFEVGAEIFGKAKMSWEPKIAETFETLPPHA